MATAETRQKKKPIPSLKSTSNVVAGDLKGHLIALTALDC
jgi:hypothetical protein